MKRRFSGAKVILRAFTLIELLVAMAVMALVLVLVSQIVGSALSWSSSSRTMMSSGEQARSTWQRMAFDMNSLVDLPSDNFRVVKQAGDNDQIEFLTDVRNTAASSRFSKVSWRVAKINNPLTRRAEPMLFRTLTPVDWTDEPAGILALSQAPVAGDLYSEGVFRLEVAFLNRDGTLTSTAPASSDDIQALVVGTAVLDSSIRGRLSDSELAALATALPDVVDGKTPRDAWSASVFGGKVAPYVRFYQQTFALNPSKKTSR